MSSFCLTTIFFLSTHHLKGWTTLVYIDYFVSKCATQWRSMLSPQLHGVEHMWRLPWPKKDNAFLVTVSVLSVSIKGFWSSCSEVRVDCSFLYQMQRSTCGGSCLEKRPLCSAGSVLLLQRWWDFSLLLLFSKQQLHHMLTTISFFLHGFGRKAAVWFSMAWK